MFSTWPNPETLNHGEVQRIIGEVDKSLPTLVSNYLSKSKGQKYSGLIMLAVSITRVGGILSKKVFISFLYGACPMHILQGNMPT